MKLCISSFGFTTKEIALSVEKLIGKSLSEVNIAIVYDAALASCGNKRWFIEESANIANFIGGNIYFVSILKFSVEEIKKSFINADIIYLMGGKKHFLAGLFRQTNTIDLLKEITHKKVIMGTSAGSMALCRQITSVKFWQERYNVSKDEIIKKPELDIVDFSIVPHFMREDHLLWDEKFLKRVLNDNLYPVYALNDNQAIIYDNGNISFVGGNPLVFGKRDK